MEQVQLALSWDSYQKNICKGLSNLQQRGEFVDMTLAADGYHVKVHQMVLSLVSPYIKDLIMSAQGSHPVLFLNNISYTTLCSILEYVYSGEVHVSQEELKDVLAAGRSLHIQGLDKMSDTEIITESVEKSLPKSSRAMKFDKPLQKSLSIVDKLKECKDKKRLTTEPPQPTCSVFVNEAGSDNIHIDLSHDEVMIDEDTTFDSTHFSAIESTDPKSFTQPKDAINAVRSTDLQFSVSNQGGLQLIYNRYIYNLRYVQKVNRHKQWRCVAYGSSHKCPAFITTDASNKVTHRTAKHNHPFEDKKIIKKYQQGKLFSGLHHAQHEADLMKGDRNIPVEQKTDIDDDE